MHLDPLGIILGFMLFVVLNCCVIGAIYTFKLSAPLLYKITFIFIIGCGALLTESTIFLMASFFADGSEFQDQLINGRTDYTVHITVSIIALVMLRKGLNNYLYYLSQGQSNGAFDKEKVVSEEKLGDIPNQPAATHEVCSCS